MGHLRALSPVLSPAAADQLIIKTRSWKTRCGKPLAPTTRSNMLSALCSGFLALTGRKLDTATARAERKLIKKALAEHVRKQAVPATLREIRRVLLDAAVPIRVRSAIRFMWVLGLRAVDLTKILGKDVLNRSRLSLDGAAVVRMRGVKGVNPGSRGYYRFVPLCGLAAPLRKIFLDTPRSKLLFAASRAEIVRALRRVNPRLSAHSPRRGAATALANAGASTREVRDHLGHTKLASTRLYIAPSPVQRDARRRIKVATLLV